MGNIHYLLCAKVFFLLRCACNSFVFMRCFMFYYTNYNLMAFLSLFSFSTNSIRQIIQGNDFWKCRHHDEQATLFILSFMLFITWSNRSQYVFSVYDPIKSHKKLISVRQAHLIVDQVIKLISQTVNSIVSSTHTECYSLEYVTSLVNSNILFASTVRYQKTHKALICR